MAKRIINGIEVESGSGNVFADLGLRNAGKLKIKSGLVIEITRAIRTLGLTQQEAAKRMGITQPKVSGTRPRIVVFTQGSIATVVAVNGVVTEYPVDVLPR